MKTLLLGAIIVGLGGCNHDVVVGIEDGGGGRGGGGAGGGGAAPELVTLTLDVQQFETDAGRVTATSSLSPVECGAHCSFQLPKNQTVKLTSSIGPRPALSSWSGDCNGLSELCTVTLDSPKTVVATMHLYNHIFSTSAAFPVGDLGDGDGGVGVADELCRRSAVDLGISGRVISWLSTSKQNAIDRVPQGVTGWVNERNGHVYPYSNDLGGGRVFVSLFADLNPPNPTPTGSDSFGRFDGKSCNDWTNNTYDFDARYGAPGGPNVALSTSIGESFQHLNVRCAMASNLACAEIEFRTPISTIILPDRLIAFVTRDQYPSGGGTEPFDQACNAEAHDAGLTGRFIADVLPASSDAGLSSHLELAGQTWARLDGMDVFTLGGDGLFLAQRVPVQVTVDGRMLVRAGLDDWPSRSDLLVGDTSVWFSGCVDFLNNRASSTTMVEHADDLLRAGLEEHSCGDPARLHCYQVSR